MSGVMFLNIRRTNMQNSSRYADMLKYYNREEAVDKSQVERMVGYYGRDAAVRFEDGGFYEGVYKDNKTAASELMYYRPLQVYQGVISFRPDDAEGLGFTTKADFADLVSNYLRDTAKILNIDYNNFIWTGYYHTNTKNPHVHFYFFDKSKCEQPLFLKRELNRSRSALARHILNQVDSYIQKDEYLKNEIDRVKEFMTEKDLEFIMQKSIIATAQRIRSGSEMNAIANQMIECAKVLPTKGSISYNVLKRYNRLAFNEVDKCVSLVVANSEEYQKFITATRELDSTFKTLYGNGSRGNYAINQEEALRAKIGNIIIGKLKDMDAMHIYQSDNEHIHDYGRSSLLLTMGSFFSEMNGITKTYLNEMMGYARRVSKSEEKKKKNVD
ncbi:MAG: relaxase MobL [Anaerorhabdus sp.]